MRIISKFHDYYDTALGFGSDPELCYVRETRELPLGTLPAPARRQFYRGLGRRDAQHFDVDVEYLIFCGKLYPTLLLRPPYRPGTEIRPMRCWTFEEVARALAAAKLGFGSRSHWFRRLRPEELLPDFASDSVEKLFEFTLPERTLVDLHQRVGSPILFATSQGRDKVLQADALLAELEFYRVVDPFAAFQSIAQYLGGVLARPGKEAEPISDAMKRDTHGFDEHSFKQASPGKKTRRRGRARTGDT